MQQFEARADKVAASDSSGPLAEELMNCLIEVIVDVPVV